MNKKINGRLPDVIPVNPTAPNSLKQHSAIKSPWEKLVSYKDAAHYAHRYNSVLSAALMQAYRILEPDYAVRSEIICRCAYARLDASLSYEPVPNEPVRNGIHDSHNIHPFMCGNFSGGLQGDWGDSRWFLWTEPSDDDVIKVKIGKKIDKFC